MTVAVDLPTRLAGVLARARARTTLLTDAVDDADLVKQHSPLMSPLVWDLAHIGNQEDFWLVRAVGGRRPVRGDIDDLYDAFRHPRQDRPALPLLGPAQARSYLAEVRAQVLDILHGTPLSRDSAPLTAGGFVFAMVAQHEQQHDETMLATHQLRRGPAVLSAPPPPVPDSGRVGPAISGEVVIPAGEFRMGTSTDPWALDNERPEHGVTVPAFAIDRAPVTNQQYLGFIDDDGYGRAELWSERGWAHRQAAGLTAPQFWERDSDGSWWRRRFGIRTPLRLHQPVLHVCWFEAEAYARWAGRRLPSEAEWEKAARWDPASGRVSRYPWGEAEPDRTHANLGQRHLEPADVGAYPAGVSATGVHQLIGDVWEWTASTFAPYPGFVAFPYDEYSAVFHGGDYRVLRGGSFGTDQVACRGTFRNWDHPIRRQIFAGFRLARDLSA
ncbi:ergothioneine biosynthesis protein EgtB [Skermania piniformis]|uniref:Hercynine oxygenase n=1 Tax=Skermania pinensis TaxID=39122 RepID=A0ABX8S5H3_9ACTN|nr:ergothioneine biosynthesis protein EgtB [Skermania piniformis]QXQ13088.1 ergothioneine biosynthesis protein EgtB [Skermania piniformis]